MKALGSALSLVIRALSPSTLPPERTLDGIDRQHGDAMARAGQHAAQGLDERALADAGHAGDADPASTGRCAASAG